MTDQAVSTPRRPGSWVVLQEVARLRWGIDLRRTYLLAELARRTGAQVAGWTPGGIRSAVEVAGRPRWPWSRRQRPWLATAELLPLAVLPHASQRARLLALDLHDEPLLQRRAMHIAPGPSDRDLERRWRENVAAFPRLIVPTASLATLARLDPERVIVAPNGTDTARIRPGPWPDRPVVGMVSGAAAGRGIEELVEAARRARAQVRELELVLWLVATDEASAAYLATLQADLARHPWIHMPGAVPFDQLGMHLARATVLCTPNPPDTYWDVAAPIKLFDGMAAGRPAVVTPRLEMSRVVASTGAGIVAASDDPDDVAAAIVRVLEDPGLARRYGEAGRRAAETTYDWRAISGALADRLLADPLFG